jgi:hypothetical protein
VPDGCLRQPVSNGVNLEKLAEITHGFSVGPDTKVQIINPDGYFENIKIKHLAERQKNGFLMVTEVDTLY